jgi:hypothetical protein
MIATLLVDWTALEALDRDEQVWPALSGVSDVEFALWLVVLGALVTDIVTTAYGLSIGLVEQNPVMRHALDSIGLIALPIAKAGALAIALAVRYTWPEYALLAPLALAVPWVLAVGINVAVILSV